MLTKEHNNRLTEVGRGTEAGELLRRYWMPIAAEAELDDKPTKAIRILAEDLVLYKDKDGRYGLIDRKCPHRGSDLTFGMVEQCGLRCNYHGWYFTETGKCLEQPYEDRQNRENAFKDRVQLRSYPVQAKTGLIWAYLGPTPAPIVPNWRNFSRKGYRHICLVHVSCNWLQVMENAFDQVHNEWMHDKWSFYLRDGSVPFDRWKIQKIVHHEFDYGWTAEVQYVDHTLVLPDRIILWPNYSIFGGDFEWVVPIDKENTLLVYQHLIRFYGEEPFKQTRIPYWFGATKAAGTDCLLARPPRNQDFVVWTGQGPVADRTAEHLGSSDAGVIMFRKKLIEQIEEVKRGQEPKGIIRDPNKYFLMLPESVPSGPDRDGVPGALLSPADIRTVGYCSGFPDEIAKEITRISMERGEGIQRAQALKQGGWKVGGKAFDREHHLAPLNQCGLKGHL